LLWKVAINVNRVLREKSDKIFVHWDKLKEEVTKQYWVSTEKVVSIVHWNFNFLKDKYSKWWEILKNNFLFFGRIVDYKWLDLLLDSLEQIKKEIPNFRLTIAWPWSLENYKNQIEKFKENISVYNFSIDAKDNYKYFETCEFVVLPYKDATWSGVVPAAYAFYKSVIVTNVWELANAVENWKTWIILEEKSIAELAESIIFMLKNKEKVIEMWKEGRKYSESVLGWKGVVEKCYFKTP
jgi:glycosyltransferase involved in cell wall biosynthesis